MSFTSEVVIGCLLLPALVAGVFAYVSALFANRLSRDADPTTTFMQSRGGTIAGVGWCLALLAAMGFRQWQDSELDWLDTVAGAEAWQTVLWPMFAFAIVLAVSRLPNGSSLNFRLGSGRFVAAGLVSAWGAFAVLPHGEGWTDLLPLHRPWFALTVASCLMNAWSLERIVRSGGDRWVLLVLLAGLGTPAMLGALNYAAPAEWTFAAIAATAQCLFVMWVLHWCQIRSSAIWAVIYPGCVVIASMTTTARFYTYEDYPGWIYAIALFLPTVVASADLLVRDRSWKFRVPIAAVLSAGMIAACVWQLVLSQPADNW